MIVLHGLDSKHELQTQPKSVDTPRPCLQIQLHSHIATKASLIKVGMQIPPYLRNKMSKYADTGNTTQDSVWIMHSYSSSERFLKDLTTLIS